MKKQKGILLVISLMLLLVTFTGCSNNQTTPDTEEFSYSNGIDDNGYWKNTKALDYVTLPDSLALVVPSDVHTISDDELENQINSLLSSYSEPVEITNRNVEDGDTINIDFVGTVDGIEFEGGSTDGAGTEVTIGYTNYIDDFLEQLIGHKPGETVRVEVTFPEDYGKEELNGKDAVFVTEINYIVGTVTPELTDGFIATNLSADYGWTTIEEMKNELRNELQKDAVSNYVSNYLMNDLDVAEPPAELLHYVEEAMVQYFIENAAYYSMELEEFLSTLIGVASVEELKESYHDYNVSQAKYYLVLQAIAEKEGLVATETDISNYFTNYVGVEDYSQYVTDYGLPYVAQVTLHQMILDYMIDHAILG